MATYDPSKKYTWTAEDKFELSGNEFGLLLNALRVLTSTPEAQRILLANEAALVIEQKMAQAVESGVVKEVEDNPQQANL
jgi:hypothetical protein